MPVKTDEATRNLIVKARQDGKTYGEIQRDFKVSGPTVASVLKEAGMTMAKKSPVRTERQSAPTATQGSQALMHRGRGNGVDDLQPPAGPKRVRGEPVGRDERVHIQCDECGVVLEGIPGDAMPDVCPECGQ